MTDPATVFIATSDLAGHMRGRAVPYADQQDVLRSGTGWVPANLAITAFGNIPDSTPFGSTGDLRLAPDISAVVDIPADDGVPGVRIYLADQKQTDGSPWECCPRTFLREALSDLRQYLGWEVVASFEHEFVLEEQMYTAPFSFSRFRSVEPFGSDLLSLLAGAGLEPENWLPEYGHGQFEFTLKPSPGLIAADRAVLAKELVRDLARRRELRANFAPLLDPDGSGNGVHIHFSLQDQSGDPVLHDSRLPGELSELGAKFAAGILRHAKAITAWTAPSPISFMRLAPARWSAGGIFLAERDREALLRICPTTSMNDSEPSRQYNLEFRAADATANPWLALGVLIRAGLEGVRSDYEAAQVWPEGSQEHDRTDIEALPRSLEEALESLAADEVVKSWFDPRLLAAQFATKFSELEQTRGLDDDGRVRKVADVY